MCLLRRIRIGKLTGHYQEKDLQVIEFIQNALDDMVMKTNNTNIIYYLINDEIYFTRETFIYNNKKRFYLKCRYKGFWKVLEKYELNSKEIKQIIKYMMEQHLKCEVGSVYHTD